MCAFGPIEVLCHLMLEIGIVILGIQFEVLVEERNVHTYRSSHVPCLLLLEVRGDEDLPAACQQRHVLGQNVRRTIALAYRSA